MNGQRQLIAQTSTSPEDQWEEWMDWNATPKTLGDQQPTPPSELLLHGSPQRSSFDRNRGPVCVPSNKETSGTPSKKRKVSAESANSPESFDAQKPSSVQNRSHSLVEKRYRSNLNDKIAELREAVPDLWEDAQSTGGPTGSAQKSNKSTVLTKAIKYIQQLEKRNKYLEDANDALRRHARSAAQEDVQNKTSPKKDVPESQKSVPESLSPQTDFSSSNSEAPRGLIPVPEDFRRLREVEPQPHYADDVRFASQEGDTSLGDISIKGGRLIGKLVIGSLAGLMVMDRITGNPEEDRGLFALPSLSFLPVAPLLRNFQYRVAFVPYNFFLWPFAKVVLVFCILGLLLFLYLFNSKPKLGKPTSTAIKVGSPQPSISPMEMRQNAWLTSIQTVWVPRHSMLPEMWGLIIETLAYMTRQLLGWRSYSWLTGRSEEEETARVRAWEIALDAQLTGGDTELSKGRLVLTLWAAGTLPKSPARIMLKALHLRVMFWQASNSTWVCRTLDLAASKLARYQWKLAQKMLADGEGNVDSPDIELPDHLAALLKRPVEEVMTDLNVHRLHNLAWNRPTRLASDGEVEIDSLDEDDTAMRGPLDILALWSSNFTLHQALQAFIESGETSETCLSQVKLALRIAPQGSSSCIRALAATAVLFETDLVTDITHLLQALPLVKPNLLPTSLVDFESLSKTIRNDVMTVIECAEALLVVMGVRHDTDVITKAMQVIERSLSGITTMGMLTFAAALRLLLVFSKDSSPVRQDRLSISRLLQTAVIEIDKLCEQSKVCPEQRMCYKMALQRVLALQHTKRRSSGVSTDTGYGSMSDEEMM